MRSALSSSAVRACQCGASCVVVMARPCLRTTRCATVRRNTGQLVPVKEPPMDDLDATLIDLFAAEPRIGVLEASRRLGVARGTVQARLDKLPRGRDPRVGPGAGPRGARLPGDRVPHPARSGRARGHDAGRPTTSPRSPRCSRRTRSPAPATCGAGWWPAPTPTCSGSSTRCSARRIVRSTTVIALATQSPTGCCRCSHRCPDTIPAGARCRLA